MTASRDGTQIAARDICLAHGSLQRLRERVERCLRLAAETHQLTVPECLLLLTIDECAAPPIQRELADRLLISPAKTSLGLDALRKHGLAAATRLAADRRRQSWRLSPDGKDTATRIRQSIIQAWNTSPESENRDLTQDLRNLQRLCDLENQSSRAA